ncbi:MAG: hypothetical protein J7L31_05405 [Thermoplasmata archaeon]|nr:hypothetical protein [Thermoplasmata archaeon]
MERGNGNEWKSVGVRPVVIKMLEKLQAHYHYRNGEKMSYGAIVEKLVTAEFSALGLELNGNEEREREERKELEVVT